jgi:hypothetical protein
MLSGLVVLAGTFLIRPPKAREPAAT